MLKDDSDIFDDVKTGTRETRDMIIRKSMSDALSFLENNYGSDLVNWQWNRMHKVVFRHMFSGQNSFVDDIINIGDFGIGGDGTTLFNTEYEFSIYNLENIKPEQNPFENVLGPSMRFIFDFANEDRFYLVLITGQSGHPLGGHYQDHTDLWRKAKYVTIHTREEKIRQLTKKLELLRGD